MNFIISNSFPGVFILCWLPYFCLAIYRGICASVAACELSHHLHINAYLITSWLGYAHSVFNPLV